MVELPAFAAWFAAVNGAQTPLPWQARLAEQVVETGWPSLIGVPTGLGKTACLDIAIWALAAEADRPPAERRHPRRIWYVVNRRLLVDVAATKVGRLARLLAQPSATGGAIGAVAERLRTFGGLGETPLYVATLRGGADLGHRPPDPAQPAIILATPAMYGSRWLFRGYGTSTGMRPIDAALAGTDSLVLLDEAHLARPLRLLASQTHACDRGRSEMLLPGGRGHVRFVDLTATGSDASDRFDLDDDDHRHPIVRRRLDAAKRIKLATETTRKKLVSELVAEGLLWREGLAANQACLLFCNDPGTARAVHAGLDAKLGAHADVLLLTGRMREREADVARAQVLDPLTGAPAGSATVDRARPLLVVATQTLEVGADLDVDYLITESAGARAVVQRLGRLNRLGDKPNAGGVIVHAADGDGGVCGAEAATVWQRLVDGAGIDRVVNLSPREVSDRVGTPADQAEDPPCLLPALLWEWAKTTVPPTGEAPVEVFVEGRDERRRRVQVCWRAVLEPFLAAPGASDEETELPKMIPPVAARETIELPIYEVAAALEGQQSVIRLSGDRFGVERVGPGDLRSGDTVVLPAAQGRYDRFGWNPEATTAVIDVSLLEGTTFLLAREALANFLTGPADVIGRLGAVFEGIGREPELDEDPPTLAALPVDEELALVHAVDADRWEEILGAVRAYIGVGRLPTGATIERSVNGVAYLRFRRWRVPAVPSVRAETLEELSFDIEDGAGPTSPILADHLLHVAATAGHVASAIGLSPELIRACARAGAFHDVGKNDDRFQRWLAPDGDERASMAKSTRPLGDIERLRREAGWPKGGRHEALSLRLLRAFYVRHPATDHDSELVLHLVASHHGHGRPSLPPCDDAAPSEVNAEIDGEEVTVSGDLSVLDWDQPARFRRLCERYGIWGLALLEAIVRQADHAVSHVAVV
jgi:CRISPR-associated endonuclease/helicase Cas3